MDDYAKAILAGATNNNLAPTSSPIATDPQMLKNISSANASKFSQALTASSANALGGAAGNQADLADNALRIRMEDAKQRQQEAERLMDPKQYQQKENDVGGFDFFDPNGKKITIEQYAKVTGKNRAELLSDSQDPTDVQFRNDYKNLQEVLEATLNKDTDKLEAYYQNQPELKGMKPDDLLKRFRAYYPGYFTQAPSNRQGFPGAGAAFSSSGAAAGNAARLAGDAEEDFG